MNPCVNSSPTTLYDRGDDWAKLHKHYVAQAKNTNPDVILIGASIIQFLQSYPIWNEKFKPLNSLNFGIAGDRTEDVLWRVQNDLLDNIKPKVCILNVGSNNIDDNTPVDISEGILAIVNEIRSRLPDCYIIIIGILPRNPYPEPSRHSRNQINEILNHRVKNMFKVELFIDNLLQPDGRLCHKDASDFLHPSEIGYQKIFEPIFERLATILN